MLIILVGGVTFLVFDEGKIVWHFQRPSIDRNDNECVYPPPDPIRSIYKIDSKVNAGIFYYTCVICSGWRIDILSRWINLI
jgi:hypothetical protein